MAVNVEGVNEKASEDCLRLQEFRARFHNARMLGITVVWGGVSRVSCHCCGKTWTWSGFLSLDDMCDCQKKEFWDGTDEAKHELEMKKWEEDIPYEKTTI